jgi:LysM repeat protein
MKRGAILAAIAGLLCAAIVFFVWRSFTSPSPPATAVPYATLAPDNLQPTLDALSATAQAPQTAVPDTQPTAPTTTYTVQPGDTLFRIAQQFGVTVDALMQANNITNPDLVTAGQILIIPTPTPASQPETAVTPPTIAESNPAPQPAANPATLRGLPLSAILIMPENVIVASRQIFTNGQTLGRNPHAYSKVGDSTIESPHFMARFDEPGSYNLGEFAYLQPTIDYFAGSHARQGAAVRKGFHSWTVTDPMWADKTICAPNETPIACEIRLHNPAFLLIRLGSNDAGVPDMFDQNIRAIVEYAIANGVVPIIGTKADRFEGASNINNTILRQIATDYQLPIWDFDTAAQIIPGRGLDVDYVHLTTYYAHDYTSPTAFERGHAVHNLTALMLLNALYQQIILPITG